MLPTGFILVAAAVRIGSGGVYTLATLRAQVRPNPITWFFWALTPLIVFAAQIVDHVGWSAVMSLAFSFSPLLVFVISIPKIRLRAHLTPVNIVCAVLASVGIILWRLADDAVLAVLFCIASDIAATTPTLVKACRAPQSECRVAYVLDLISALITVAAAPEWTFTTVAFALYVLLINLVILGYIKIGYLRQNRMPASDTKIVSRPLTSKNHYLLTPRSYGHTPWADFLDTTDPRQRKAFISPGGKNVAEFDYIVVGAGSAGCVLADRLSATGMTVLLLEVGGSDRTLNVRIPAAFGKLFKTKRDWCYNTDPEPHLEGRTLFVPRVGAHLQDQAVAIMTWATTAKGTLAEAEKPASLLRYLARCNGLLSSVVAEGGGFVRSRAGLDAPDLQLIFGPAFFQDHGFQTYDGAALGMAPILLAPRSRGTIWLRSADPAMAPRISVNVLADRQDVEAMLAGIETVRAITHTPPLAGLVGDPLVPGPETISPADAEQWLRQKAELVYNPSCSTRMGGPDEAAVNPSLQVYGVEGLRVVDASVMPTITRGNTNAPTIMIAEKTADLILAGTASWAVGLGRPVETSSGRLRFARR